jgi:hypothetical protein
LLFTKHHPNAGIPWQEAKFALIPTAGAAYFGMIMQN